MRQMTVDARRLWAPLTWRPIGLWPPRPPDGWSSLSLEISSACVKSLRLETEQLIRRQPYSPSARTLQKSKMQDDHVLGVCVDSIEDRLQVVQRVVVSSGHQHTARSDAKRLRREIVARLEVELIELCVGAGVFSRRSLRDREDREENQRKRARHGCHFLQQVDHAERKQDGGDDSQAYGSDQAIFG